MRWIKAEALGRYAALMLALGWIDAAPAAPRAASPPGALYSIMLIDIAPDRAADGAALLADHAASLRSARGCVSVRLVRQPAPSANHFAILTTWRSGDDRDRYLSGMASRRFRNRLQPIAASPVDDRIYRPMAR